MKSILTLILFTLGFSLIVSSNVAASPQPAPPLQIESAVSTTFLIAFEPNLTAEERSGLLQRYNAELIHWIPEINLAEVRFTDGPSADENNGQPGSERLDRLAMATQAARVGSDPDIEFIEENALFHGTDVIATEIITPDDPELYDSTNGYAQQLLHMESAWGQTMGDASVVIAVLDTGVDASHPELFGQLVSGYDFVNNSASVIDDNGHGTHVSGIIGARINNHQGSAGICPRCKMMPVKVLDKNNVGVWSVIVRGIIFAVDNGAQIINLSLGSADQSDAVQRAVEYAQENGALLVAAAGNSRSRELFYPAAYAGVISVAATDNEDREWSLSNQGTYIDVAAPGYLIYSTSISSERYIYMTGTSMAAPFVSGLAGLILSHSPHSSAAEISDRIILNTVDLGKPGWDSTFGFGRVDAYAALSADNMLHAHSPNGLSGQTPSIYLPLINQ